MEIVIFILAVAVVSLMVGQFGLREKHRQLNTRLNGEVHGLRKCFKKNLDLNAKHMHGHIADLVDAIKTVDGSRTDVGNNLFNVVSQLAEVLGYEVTFERKKGSHDIEIRKNHTMGGFGNDGAVPTLSLVKKQPKKAPQKKAPARRRR